MKKNNKKIAVVTGGAGFIGSHMVDLLLQEGYYVRVIDNLRGGNIRNLEHLSGYSYLSCEWKDICDLKPGSKTFKDADFVFHFAGIGDIVPSIDKPADYMKTNVQGTVCVLECARHNKIKKLVYAASSSCYGLADTPTTEEHKIAPQYQI